MSFQVSLAVSVVFVVGAAYSCCPVASEKQSSHELVSVCSCLFVFKLAKRNTVSLSSVEPVCSSKQVPSSGPKDFVTIS